MSPHLAAGRMLHVGACRCVASCPVQFGWRGWGRLALSAQVPQGEQAAPARQLSEREPANAITPVRMPNAGTRLSRRAGRGAGGGTLPTSHQGHPGEATGLVFLGIGPIGLEVPAPLPWGGIPGPQWLVFTGRPFISNGTSAGV